VKCYIKYTDAVLSIFDYITESVCVCSYLSDAELIARDAAVLSIG